MAYEIIAETTTAILNLTEDPERWFLEYAGFDPPAASLLTSAQFNADGELFQASQLQPRNIVLTFYLFKDVDVNRRLLYSVFKTGQYIKLSYNNDTLNVYTEGYVETIDAPQFGEIQNARQIIKISIMCYEPAMIDQEERTIDFSMSASFQTRTDVPTPCKLTLKLSNTSGTTLQNPSFSLMEHGTNNMYLSSVSRVISGAYQLEIDSEAKTIDLTINGVRYADYLRYRTIDSTWFMLPPGGCTVRLELDNISGLSNAVAQLVYRRRYLGV